MFLVQTHRKVLQQAESAAIFVTSDPIRNCGLNFRFVPRTDTVCFQYWMRIGQNLAGFPMM